MENIDLTTIDKTHAKNIKYFFLIPKIKTCIERNDFDLLFAEYNDYKLGNKCRWNELIKIFDYLKIDWINHSSFIPSFAYSNRDIENLELPKNIIRVDGTLTGDSSSTPIMNITYDGKVEDFKKIVGYAYLREALKQGGKIICSDGTIQKVR